METQARYLTVGSFVLILLLGVLGFVLWMGKKEFSGRDNLYDIFFQGSVTGLKVGAQVLYRGVPVGSVQSIVIDPHNIEQIRVRVNLLPNTPIREDTVASLEMQGITGIAFVQLTSGSPNSPPLLSEFKNSYPIIHSKPSKIDEIFETAPRLLKTLNKLAHDLDLILNTNNIQNFSSVLENLKIFTQNFENKAQKIDQFLESADMAFREISETSKSFRTLAHTLQSELIPLSQSAHNFFQESSEFLDANKIPLQTFLTSGLYEFSNVMSEFRMTLESIKHLSTNLERDPWAFIFGTGDDGYVLN